MQNPRILCHKQQMGQYKKDVSAEALRLAGQITKEKDEEIQQLTEELNQYKYKPGESLSQLGGNDSITGRYHRRSNGRGDTKDIPWKS